MATITLKYNARSSTARRLLEMLLGSGLFSRADEPKPNAKTMAAIREARSGKPLPKVDTSSVDAMIASIMR